VDLLSLLELFDNIPHISTTFGHAFDNIILHLILVFGNIVLKFLRASTTLDKYLIEFEVTGDPVVSNEIQFVFDMNDWDGVAIIN